MKMPLIVDENGDVSIYWSVSDAVKSLEAIDVINNEYVGYDGSGSLLKIKVLKSSAVDFSLDEGSLEYEENSIAALKKFIQARRQNSDVSGLNLNELISFIQLNQIKN